MNINSIIMDIRKYVYDNHWTIGFPQNSLGEIINGSKLDVKWMKNPYTDRWFADPFILCHDNKEIVLLVEEFCDRIQRGRISKIVVSRSDYRLKNVEVVLELPTHLSFPAIKRKNGLVYIYPENGASNKLILYQYNPDSNECIEVCNMAEGYLADAIETDLFGESLLFTTIVPEHNSNKLVVMSKGSDCRYHPYKTVLFDSNIARNAGDWFNYSNSVYRPAQNCTFVYGGEMIIQKVFINNDGDFVFETIRRIKEQYKSYNLGCHTFNHYNGVSVIDVNGYRRPLLATFGKWLAQMRKRV